MRGRKPKPTALKALAGNPGKRKLNPAEPELPVSEVDAPVWLGPVAREEWIRLASTLLAAKILTVGDRNSLAAYCENFAAWRRAQAVIARRGLTFKTRSGYEQQRPEVSIAQKSMALMLKFAVEFGLTPASRTRLDGGSAPKDPKGKKDEEFFKDGKPAGASHAARMQ